MPSFDVVSKVDTHEITNAVDQANREVSTRYDLKNTGAKFELKDEVITLTAEAVFHLQQMLPILQGKFTKRGIDIRCLKIEEPKESLHEAKQEIKIRQGIEQELAKKITKLIKDSKIKVQASIQGDQIRVTGKKRDDLQETITLLREQELDLPLQFENFRD